MTVLGNNLRGSDPLCTARAIGRLYVSKYNLAVAGNLTELHCLCNTVNSAAAGTARLVVYAADGAGGNPGTRLYYSSPLVTQGSRGEFELAVTGISVPLAAGNYWLGWVDLTLSATGNVYGDPSGGSHFGWNSGATDPPPNPFGAGDTSGVRKHSIWGVVGVAVNPGGITQKFKFGSGLGVTDEGSGVVRVDAAGSVESKVDAKGDLLAASANDTLARLPVGVNGKLLIADSSQATGLKWGDPSLGLGGTWRAVSGVPPLGEGIEGDWHYDSASGYVYRKRIAPPIPVVKAFSQNPWSSYGGSLNYPAGSASGDLLVAVFAAYNSLMTVPSGWTQAGIKNLGLGNYWQILWKFRGAETAQQFDASTNIGGVIRFWAFQSNTVHPTNPVPVFDAVGSTINTLIPAPTILLPLDGLVLRAWQIGSDLTGGGYTLPSGDTQSGVYYWSAGSFSSISAYKQELAGNIPAKNLILATAAAGSGASIGMQGDISSAPLEWLQVGKFVDPAVSSTIVWEDV